MNAPDFAFKIITLKTHFAFSVTSWFRTPAHNKAVGGQPNSMHLYGLGIDLVVDDPADIPALTHTANEMGLSVLNEGDHLHLQPNRQNR